MTPYLRKLLPCRPAMSSMRPRRLVTAVRRPMPRTATPRGGAAATDLYWQRVRAVVRLLLTTAMVYTFAWPSLVASRADLPTPRGAINDFADVLSDCEEQTIDRGGRSGDGGATGRW